MFWRHYFIVKLNCFILRTSTVAGLGVPIFRVFTVDIVQTHFLFFFTVQLCISWTNGISSKFSVTRKFTCDITSLRGKSTLRYRESTVYSNFMIYK